MCQGTIFQLPVTICTKKSKVWLPVTQGIAKEYLPLQSYSKRCFLSPNLHRLLLYQVVFFFKIHYENWWNVCLRIQQGLFLKVIRKNISSEGRVYYETWTKLKSEEFQLLCSERIQPRSVSSEPGSDPQCCPKPHDHKQAQRANKISFMEHSDFFKLIECSVWNRLEVYTLL